MFIASLAIFPTSEGASVSRYVKEVIRIIEDSGLENQTGGMNTTIESPDLDSLFRIIQKAHDKLADMGVSRIRIEMSVDHRLDKEGSISQKLKSLKK